jgi:hypothetical protein
MRMGPSEIYPPNCTDQAGVVSIRGNEAGSPNDLDLCMMARCIERRAFVAPR